MPYFVCMELIPIPAADEPDLPGTIDPYTTAMIVANQEFYGRVGHTTPWVCYLALREGVVVGTCGFKGAPRSDQAEIAYHTYPEHERQGVASWMAGRLIQMAEMQDGRVQLTAQTLPENNASTRILERLGFSRTADGHDEDVGLVWCWERRRT